MAKIAKNEELQCRDADCWIRKHKSHRFKKKTSSSWISFYFGCSITIKNALDYSLKRYADREGRRLAEVGKRRGQQKRVFAAERSSKFRGKVSEVERISRKGKNEIEKIAVD